MIKLTDDEKQFIQDNKSYLKNNDIIGFCKKTQTSMLGHIMQFLMENGIDVFNYIEEVPAGMFNGAEFDTITIPDHITKLGSSAFANCVNLASVKIGDSVTSIGNKAFSNCPKLKQVFLPNSVRILGENIFAGNDDVIIYAEERTGGTRLKCKKNEIPWYKEHLFRQPTSNDSEEAEL